MKRISFVTSSLGQGGAQHSTLRLAHGFSRSKKFEVDLVCQNAVGPLAKEVPAEVETFDLEAKSKHGVYLRALSSLPGMVKYLQSRKPSLLIASHPRLTNCVAILASRIAKSGTATLFIERNSLESYIGETGFAKKIKKYTLRMCYSWSDSIVSVSGGVKKNILDIAPSIAGEDVDVVYNPAYHTEVLRLSKKEVRHNWFKNGSYPVIIGAGTLSERKDFPTLIRAFSILRKDKEAKLIILGEGSERNRLVNIANKLGVKKHIYLPGFVNNPYKYMRRSDVFVLSSRLEGFGNVIVEALACGCPVVSTNCPSGPDEILEGGKWGRLVPVGEPKPMAKAIRKSLDEKTINIQARAKDFKLEHIVNELTEVIQRI